MDGHKNFRIVTLKDLGVLFLRRIWVMLLAATICIGAFVAFLHETYEPMYESTATLYILHQADEATTSGDASSDFSLALKVVNDCTYLLKSHTVLDRTIAELGLNISYEELYERVSTFNPTDTRILEVRAEAESPEQAKQIADKICQLGQQSITDAMGFEQVNLFAYGTLDAEPCNAPSLLVYIMIGVAAMILTYSVFLVLALLDDRIRTSDDIERYLHLNILGEIPNMKQACKIHGGYYVPNTRDKSRRRGR